MAKQIPLKQLEKQLDTWRKNDPETYQEILELAKLQGTHNDILTKSGQKVSFAQNVDRQKLIDFSKQYAELFGSYTSYNEKRKEEFKEYKEERPETKIKSAKDYERLKKKVHELYDEYRTYYAVEQEKTADVFEIVSTMEIQEQIDFLEERISQDKPKMQKLVNEQMGEYLSGANTIENVAQRVPQTYVDSIFKQTKEGKKLSNKYIQGW